MKRTVSNNPYLTLNIFKSVTSTIIKCLGSKLYPTRTGTLIEQALVKCQAFCRLGTNRGPCWQEECTCSVVLSSRSVWPTQVPITRELFVPVGPSRGPTTEHFKSLQPVGHGQRHSLSPEQTRGQCRREKSRGLLASF